MIEIPKLRTYRLFNVNLKLEKYLLTYGYYKNRSLMTSIRTGTNELMIERGRWLQLPVGDRTCVQCSMNQVENKIHFLVICPKYESLRQELFSQVSRLSS